MQSKFYFVFLLLVFCLSYEVNAQLPAFPGAEGFGAFATGGRGGKVIYVTNLNVDGPGSLQAAFNESGKRYILFKVSGTIPATIEVPPGHGDFTLAGQTSPNGIIVRGFQSYHDENVSSTNFILRHLRSRIGDLTYYPATQWIGGDGITLGGVHNAIIDHCSFAHANDEAVDISRSSALTIQNCLLAETLGSHSYLGGMLINYSSPQSRLDSLSIHHNLWNRIGGRMPEISCESPYCGGKTIHMELSNNLFWDPRIELWYEGITGNNSFFYLHMNAVNNYSYAQTNYSNAMFHADLLHQANNALYFEGNRLNLYPQYEDFDLFYCCNDFDLNHPNTETGSATRPTQAFNFPAITHHNTGDLRNYMVSNAGAFPRDAMDDRLMQNVVGGNFDPSAIDVDHYRDPFSIVNAAMPPVDSDSDGMPDYWEERQGLNPALQDHNETNLSQLLYGVQGYTNLECYLHCLSDALVNGASQEPCRIGISTSDENTVAEVRAVLFPNPTSHLISIDFSNMPSKNSWLQIFNASGASVDFREIGDNQQLTFDTTNWPPGLYAVVLHYDRGIKPLGKFLVIK
ncbi:MAG: T9SS type A sorting domain-containing protein [Saprospiraceae bacterium]|nr:T9SS type A sorting domain-containing protein [Saprospiraceae bacterium]